MLRNGSILVFKQAISIALGLLSLFWLTKEVGIDNYGPFAVGMVAVSYLTSICALGSNIRIVSRSGDKNQLAKEYFVSIFYFALSVCVVSVAILISVAKINLNVANFYYPILIMLPTIIINSLSFVFIGSLESERAFARISIVEIISQVSYILTAFAALKTNTPYPLIVGWYSQSVIAFVGYSYGKNSLFCFLAKPNTIKSNILQGLTYSAANLIWNAKNLIWTFVFSASFGASTTGHLNMAYKIAENAAFIKGQINRMLLPRLSSFSKKSDVSEYTNKTAIYRLAAVAVPLLITSIFLDEIVGHLGSEWKNVAIFFPLVAVGYIFNGAFSIFSSILFMDDRDKSVGVFHAAYIFLFSIGIAVGNKYYGYYGILLAEILGMAAYYYLFLQVKRIFGSQKVKECLFFAVASGAAINMSSESVKWIMICLYLIRLFFQMSLNITTLRRRLSWLK